MGRPSPICRGSGVHPHPHPRFAGDGGSVPIPPCATLSMLTYYRTSRSLHFPFWAVCSLSGAQPEIWSVSWKLRVHRIAFRLFVAFPLNQRPWTSFVVSPAGGRGGPGLLWPGPLGSAAAQGPRPRFAEIGDQAVVLEYPKGVEGFAEVWSHNSQINDLITRRSSG
jgi:hypothetical protein